MLNIFISWFLCCSGFLSLHSALVLPLNGILNVSSNFETQALSIDITPTTKSKTTFFSETKCTKNVEFLSFQLKNHVEQLIQNYWTSQISLDSL
jgi:hypothetical protein